MIMHAIRAGILPIYIVGSVHIHVVQKAYFTTVRVHMTAVFVAFILLYIA